jgi:hypothetical protein
LLLIPAITSPNGYECPAKELVSIYGIFWPKKLVASGKIRSKFWKNQTLAGLVLSQRQHYNNPIIWRVLEGFAMRLGRKKRSKDVGILRRTGDIKKPLISGWLWFEVYISVR